MFKLYLFPCLWKKNWPKRRQLAHRDQIKWTFTLDKSENLKQLRKDKRQKKVQYDTIGEY